MPITGSYYPVLVALSVFISMSAAYAALDLAGRVTAARRTGRFAWLTGGAIAMGVGIWSMHFVGMRAFTLAVPIVYSWPVVLVSLLVGILASAFSLFVVSRKTMGQMRIVSASVIMGGGIVAVHYIGMKAIRVPAQCIYSPALVTLSVAIAIVASFIALWLGFHFREEIPGTGWQKIAGAVVAGAAISSMHYTAMAAASFTSSSAPINLAHTIGVSTLGAVAVASATLIVQGAAVLTSFVDRRFAIQRDELFASRLLLLQEDERRRIALDLHDVLGQELTAAKLNLGRLGVYVGDERGQKLLSETEHLLATCIDEVRTLSQALRPPDIESLGLRAALVVYAENFRTRSGIELNVDVPEKLPKLPGRAEATLLKVVQECLLNIQRHSGSRRVRIRVHVDLSQLILEVIDEGGGIKPETLDNLRSGASGVGIAGMHERLESLGGRLEVTSGPAGTTVRAVLPIRGSRAL